MTRTDKEKLEAISKEIGLIDFGYEKYGTFDEKKLKMEWKSSFSYT